MSDDYALLQYRYIRSSNLGTMEKQLDRYLYHFEVLTRQGSLVADVTFKRLDDLDEFAGSFMGCFTDLDALREHRKFEAAHVKSDALLGRVQAFADRWRAQLVQLQRLPALMRKLNDGEHLIVLPGATVDRMGRMGLFMYLQARAEDVPVEHIREPFMDLVGDLLKRYVVRSWGDLRETIGHRNEGSRTCRFCGGAEPAVQFSKVAHAISEALGNKTLRLLDECDTCNGKFATAIEDDAVEYFAHYLTFHGVKGKGGSRTMDGSGFEAKHTVEGVKIDVFEEGSISSTDDELVVTLEGGKPFALLNVYRALCKYFLSVVPPEELGRFSRTLRWVKGDETIESLPKLALRQNARFSMQPTLMSYRRLDDDTRTPYTVVEFQMTSLTVVFVVPGSDADDRTFADSADFERFRQTFRHHGPTDQWSFQDFSNPDKRTPRRLFKFVKRSDDTDGSSGPLN